MPALVVGGVTIPVAPDGVSRDRLDHVDRARAFDGTYRASATGNPKRSWIFSTPPLPRGAADLYESVLANVAAQVCSGDLPGVSSNLLAFPEGLDNAAWTKSGVTILADNATAPNGTVTADKMREDTSTGSHAVLQEITAPLATYTLSAWLASVERTKALLMISDGVGGFASRGFDLAAGTTFSSGFSVGAWADISYTLTIPIPTASWYLATVTGRRAAGTVSKAQIHLWTTAESYTGTSGSGMNVWRPWLSNDSSAVSCCSEITGWTPVKVAVGHRVVLSFALHEV